MLNIVIFHESICSQCQRNVGCVGERGGHKEKKMSAQLSYTRWKPIRYEKWARRYIKFPGRCRFENEITPKWCKNGAKGNSLAIINHRLSSSLVRKNQMCNLRKKVLQNKVRKSSIWRIRKHRHYLPKEIFHRMQDSMPSTKEERFRRTGCE